MVRLLQSVFQMALVCTVRRVAGWVPHWGAGSPEEAVTAGFAGEPVSSGAAQRAPPCRGLQGFPQIQLLSLSLQPGAFPAGCPHGLVSYAIPFSLPFPGPLGLTPSWRSVLTALPAQLLLMETELLVASQYLWALMQKKVVCKSEEERGQLSARLLLDATQLRELFCGLVRGAVVCWGAGAGHTVRSVQGAHSFTPSPSCCPLGWSCIHQPMNKIWLLHLGSWESRTGGTGWIRDSGDYPPCPLRLHSGTC